MPGGKAILVVALCPVKPCEDGLLIDRKFHTGMLEYVRRLRRPLACLLPRMAPSQEASATTMELVTPTEIPYRVHVVSGPVPEAADIPTLRAALDETALAHVGDSTKLNLTIADMCRERGVPYVATSEYTLRTVLDIMRGETRSPLRRVIRELRSRIGNRSRLELLANAAEVHTNGYPTYLELADVNPRRMLFFDTRATAEDVISEPAVVRRLDSLDHRPPRLLYSGRYHTMKGALDVVRTGIELFRRGVKFKLDTYGAGSLQGEMVEMVRRSGTGECITIHGLIPYRPNLIDVTRDADLFLACHTQGDPSCTYLETFACGVPIAGYANEMWTVLQRESRGGVAAPVGDPVGLASEIEAILRDRQRLTDASLRARAFAAANTMEVAWDRRTERFTALVGESPAGRS
jgi:glycosyltransferase involved in cell wall biosynthesis